MRADFDGVFVDSLLAIKFTRAASTDNEMPAHRPLAMERNDHTVNNSPIVGEGKAARPGYCHLLKDYKIKPSPLVGQANIKHNFRSEDSVAGGIFLSPNFLSPNFLSPLMSVRLMTTEVISRSIPADETR